MQPAPYTRHGSPTSSNPTTLIQSFTKMLKYLSSPTSPPLSTPNSPTSHPSRHSALYQLLMQYQDISLQWQLQNEDLRNLSVQIEPIEFALQRMDRCLATQFKLLTFMTQTQHHVQKLNKNPEQYKLNRYAEYMTFEPTRVHLGKDKDSIENYINANFIDFLGKRVIATQAPISKATFYNFWRMVEQYQVTRIFMLANVIEKAKPKCDRYYPQPTLNDAKLHQKQYEITLLKEVDLNLKKTVRIRTLQLKNTLTQQITVVTHYQLTDWLDGETPNPKTKKWLHYLIDEFINSVKEDSIPLVHCSAGVGRTGTFILLALLRLIIADNSKISIFSQVRKAREQRWGMVHTLAQYEYLYSFAEREIEKLHNGLDMCSADSESEGEMETK